jgi:hypothetical protein
MNTMKNPATPMSHNHQRKIKYIDHVLQKWLLIALVVLEVLVLSVAGAILYVRLNAIVDESLYRIHFAGQHSMFAALLNESLRIIGGLIAVNLLALFVADRIWAYYVRSIISPLRVLLTRTYALDFRVDSEISERHEVLTRTLRWRRIERARHEAVHHALDQLEAKSASSDPDFRQSLLMLQALLPLPSRAAPLPQLVK